MQLEDIGSRLPEGITPDGIKPNATEGQKQPTLATYVQAKGTLTRTQHRPSPEKRGRGAFRPKSGRTKRGVLFTVESPEGGKKSVSASPDELLFLGLICIVEEEEGVGPSSLPQHLT
jgi:hypothetical protein